MKNTILACVVLFATAAFVFVTAKPQDRDKKKTAKDYSTYIVVTASEGASINDAAKDAIAVAIQTRRHVGFDFGKTIGVDLVSLVITPDDELKDVVKNYEVHIAALKGINP